MYIMNHLSNTGSVHRLPNGVRTNGVSAELPQYTIIMAYLWHYYGNLWHFYKTTVCPDPVWKPVISVNHLSNTTCLTQVFFNMVNSVANHGDH